eukprot:CAMPEP_0116870560 /NCGR_PEP_ID=MMETSP0463-20121206/498_1 /TAXON_ID=181622 /ORGANISM="Strombidinopsis sp, Strain SopsisLIS2011" /LENGTH=128 /DNA_ID=CAMNT_0004507279 /DNA_START=190 /DNA_END=576 /DNA_ORIENTATION=-
MTENFLEEHQKVNPNATGKTIKGGYPDNGNGYYSRKLSYEHWFKFNLHQRAHLLALESIFNLCFEILLTGIFTPWAAFTIGCVIFVARIVTVIGYLKKPEFRAIGGIVVILSTMVLHGYAIYNVVQFF